MDVVICTHNDADHANGIIGFLESGLECREIWLPAEWLAVLEYALEINPEVVGELIQQARRAVVDFWQHAENALEMDPYQELIEAYGDYLAPEAPTIREDRHDTSAHADAEKTPDGWPSALVENLERAKNHPWGVFWPLLEPWWRVAWLLGHDPYVWALVSGALDAAERIRAIAARAYHRRIAVRWFKYDPRWPVGGEQWLRPVNAREVMHVPSVSDCELLHALALTTANKESLVFFAEPGRGYPGVLFTADSDLKHTTLPPDLTHAIVTAPHHGSDANAPAYSAVGSSIGSACETIKWVRSDGRFRKRPGRSFLNTPSDRFCTRCRPNQGDSQAIRLTSDHGCWLPQRGVRLCSCN